MKELGDDQAAIGKDIASIDPSEPQVPGQQEIDEDL